MEKGFIVKVSTPDGVRYLGCMDKMHKAREKAMVFLTAQMAIRCMEMYEIEKMGRCTVVYQSWLRRRYAANGSVIGYR